MAQEIERKFLVKNDQWRQYEGQTTIYRQGYIYTQNATTVRVRVAGSQGFLTIKGKTSGKTRTEFEYSIPLEEAQEMLDNLCDPPLIEKTRTKLKIGNLTWEIDEFTGENEGLILAEVELDDENQEIEIPEWIGEEVTDDPRYYNANLVKNPYLKFKTSP
jgi:CYTH domain-containing protein